MCSSPEITYICTYMKQKSIKPQGLMLERIKNIYRYIWGEVILDLVKTVSISLSI